MKTTSSLAPIPWLVCLLAASAPAPAGQDPTASTVDSSIDTNSVTVVLTAGEHRVANEKDGHSLAIDGFGYRMEPGKPLLPAKSVLIGLPPGARPESVEVRTLAETELPGTYRVIPTPPIVPLAGSPESAAIRREMEREWQRNNAAAYSSNRAYPENVVELTGSGRLRKYAYASLSFCPFSYKPASGRLVRHDVVEVVIRLDLPDPASAAAQEVRALSGDTAADDRAARYFANYGQIKHLYPRPPRPDQAPGYVVVTTDAAADVVESSLFADWKATLGYEFRIVRTGDPEIAGQPGRDLAERIRNFLRGAYVPWSIEYVLLVGGIDTVPMRYCFPDPGNHSHNPGNASNPGGSVPTDYYYADLSLPEAQSWDADGDGFPGEYGQDTPDFLAEVAVGRIPSNATGRIAYALEQAVTFERDSRSWKNHALHAGAIIQFANQNNGPYPTVDGATPLAYIEADLMSGWTVSRYAELEGLEPSEYPWPPLSLEAFSIDWRTGYYGVVNWYGHGSAAGAYRTVWQWDDGDGVPETDGSDGMSYPPFIDLSALLDDDYPSIVFATSCSVGYPEPNPGGNLGVDLLTDPDCGASVGVVSATRSAFASADFAGNPGGADALCYEFNRFLIDGPTGPQKVGDALYDAKFYGHQHYARDSYWEYKNLFDFNLYGDPSLDRRGIDLPLDPR
jgi:hypothetical protein